MKVNTMLKTNTVSVSEEDYKSAVDDYMGFCVECEEFTRECTEPDAEDYDCPVCDNNSVVGAENALMMGLIEF